MLESAIQNQLKEYLKMLRQPIELIGSLDQSDVGREMGEMLQEIASLSDSVALRTDGQSAHKPSFAVAQQGQAGRVEFAGIPTGHEFTSLVLALLHVGGHPPKIEQAVVEQIKAINKPLKFETFISLSCHNCPDVVQALNTMSALNPNIQHVMIDGAVNQDLVNERKVMAVPTVFLNGEPFASGRMTVEEILNKVDDSAIQKQAEKISQKDLFDMLIVGGGPAGASAAIYAARKGLNTGIVAERFGGQVMDTLGIENFISVKATEGPKLVTALEQHVSEYDVDVMNLQRAKALAQEGDVFRVDLESGASVRSKSIVISTGARWRELNVPGEQQYKGKGVAYCPHCDGPLFKGKPVAVIGGGNSGIEAAIDLAGIVSQVTVLEFADSLRADQVLINKANSMPNIQIIKSAQTTEVLGNGEKVTGIRYTDRTSGESHDIALDGIFVQIGLLPNTDWVKGALELSRHGEIVVDAKGQTSIPGVFAAGDCTTVPYKQIIIAMGEGANASLGAFDYLIRQTPKAA